MRARAAASRATKLLESVVVTTYSNIDETHDLLRHPGPPFPPLLAMRTAPPCAVRWPSHPHRHLQGVPGSLGKAACKRIRGCMQSVAHKSALTSSPFRRDEVSVLL